MGALEVLGLVSKIATEAPVLLPDAMKLMADLTQFMTDFNKLLADFNAQKAATASPAPVVTVAP